MARILILDDNLRVLDEMEKHIRKRNPKHTVVPCRDCSTAICELDTTGAMPFDFYILDLNVNTIGLTDDQAAKTQNGLRTGWVFLVEELLKRDKEALKKTVFFSGWLTQLEAYVASDDARDNEKALHAQLKSNKRLVSKTSRYNSLDAFL